MYYLCLILQAGKPNASTYVLCASDTSFVNSADVTKTLGILA